MTDEKIVYPSIPDECPFCGSKDDGKAKILQARRSSKEYTNAKGKKYRKMIYTCKYCKQTF